MRSKFEIKIANELRKLGVPFEYEVESFEYVEPLRKNRAHCGDCGSSHLLRTGWYTPDFWLSNGTIIEAKGRFTAADRRKQLAVKDSHPDIDIKLLFMRNNKISRRSKTTYTDWCERYGFDYSVGKVKKEWIK